MPVMLQLDQTHTPLGPLAFWKDLFPLIGIFGFFLIPLRLYFSDFEGKKPRYSCNTCLTPIMSRLTRPSWMITHTTLGCISLVRWLFYGGQSWAKKTRKRKRGLTLERTVSTGLVQRLQLSMDVSSWKVLFTLQGCWLHS